MGSILGLVDENKSTSYIFKLYCEHDDLLERDSNMQKFNGWYLWFDTIHLSSSFYS